MNKDFDEALEALEKSVNQNNDNSETAEEGIKDLFKPKSAEELVAKQKKSISKIKDTAKIDELLAQVNEATTTYNKIVNDMIAATKSFEAGEIDKKELATKISSLSKEAKDYGSMIKHGKLLPSKSGASDEDLKFLKTYLEGVKDALNARKSELSGGGDSAEEGCGKSKCGKESCVTKKGCESTVATECIIYDEVIVKESMTQEELDIYNNFAVSIAEESSYIEDLNDENVAIEGVNIDASKQYKASVKEINTLIKAAKKAKKAGNVSEANSCLDQALAKVKECESYIKGLDQSVGTAVLGYYAGNFRWVLKTIGITLVTFGIGAYIKYIQEYIRQFDVLIANIKKYKSGELKAADWNRLTNMLLADLKNLEKSIGKLKANVNTAGNKTEEEVAEAEEGIIKKIKERRAAKKAKKEAAGDSTCDEATCESIYDITDEELTALETLGIAEEGIIKGIREKIKNKKDTSSLIKELKSIAKGIDGNATIKSSKIYGGIGFLDLEDVDDDSKKSEIVSAIKAKCKLEKNEKDDTIYTIFPKDGEAEEGCKATESIDWDNVTNALESMIIGDDNISLGLESMVSK